VSEYENVRPTSILSSENSRPSTSTPVPKAICSFSVKKSSGMRSSTIRPTGRGGNSFSGHSLVSSRGSKSSSGCSSSLIICTSSSQEGKSPAPIAAYRSLVAWPRPPACTFAASSSVMLRTPCLGIQWYLTSTLSPAALTHR
jgi:hypothetical protein